MKRKFKRAGSSPSLTIIVGVVEETFLFPVAKHLRHVVGRYSSNFLNLNVPLHWKGLSKSKSGCWMHGCMSICWHDLDRVHCHSITIFALDISRSRPGEKHNCVFLRSATLFGCAPTRIRCYRTVDQQLFSQMENNLPCIDEMVVLLHVHDDKAPNVRIDCLTESTRREALREPLYCAVGSKRRCLLASSRLARRLGPKHGENPSSFKELMSFTPRPHLIARVESLIPAPLWSPRNQIW